MAAEFSASAFRPVVKGGRTPAMLRTGVLLLDVLAEDLRGAPSAEPAKYDPDHRRFARH
jgi:hypothetical protein